ncbi:MAG: cytochrome c-type biogenesis protein [Pseudomonadota bacterium]
MRALAAWALLLWTAISPAALAAEAQPVAEDPALERRLQVLAKELRCLVCQNESLADSQAELANDLRREVRDLMRSGKTDAEVKQYLVARYGDFVLYRPPVKGSTYLLWVGPFVLLAVALAVLIVLLRRRRRLVRAPGLDADQARRAEQLLAGKGFDRS